MFFCGAPPVRANALENAFAGVRSQKKCEVQSVELASRSLGNCEAKTEMASHFVLLSNAFALLRVCA